MMETKFNVFENLQIAEAVENNAANFYLKTALLFENSELREICNKLANWKAKHEKILAQRRKEYSQRTGEFGTFDPDNYVLSNPHVMAGLSVFASKQGSTERMTGKESREEILKDAIIRAKEAIIFYTGLKDFARNTASEESLDTIVEEEKRYIRLLTELMEK